MKNILLVYTRIRINAVRIGPHLACIVVMQKLN